MGIRVITIQRNINFNSRCWTNEFYVRLLHLTEHEAPSITIIKILITPDKCAVSAYPIFDEICGCIELVCQYSRYSKRRNEGSLICMIPFQFST